MIRPPRDTCGPGVKKFFAEERFAKNAPTAAQTLNSESAIRNSIHK
jgi:hypothetical protein